MAWESRLRHGPGKGKTLAEVEDDGTPNRVALPGSLGDDSRTRFQWLRDHLIETGAEATPERAATKARQAAERYDRNT